MVKKCDLQSVFEHIVKTQKCAVFRGQLTSIDSFRLKSVGKLGSKSGCYIALEGLHYFDDGDCIFVTLARSYPMSYKSAYHTLVRL